MRKWVFAAAMIVSFWWDMIHLMLSMKVFEGFILWLCMLCQMAIIAVIYYLIETKVHTWVKKKKRQIVAGLTVVWGVMLSLLLFYSTGALLRVTGREWMLYSFFVVPPAFLTLIIKRTLEY